MSDLALAATPGAALIGRGPGLAAALGRTLHAAYQERALGADAAFEAELPLQETFVHGSVRISLRGRADGVRPEGDGWLVEELKSLSARRDAWLPAWRLQAALYARMLGRARRAPARAELVWIGGEVPLRERVELAPGELEAEVARALDRCLAELARTAELRAAWRVAADAVRFPFATLRPGQREIVASVEHALTHGEQLLIEAATGSGKTAAILTPALRHAMQTGRRLFVLSAATLQQKLAVETLGRLAPGGVPLVSRLRAKRRMCTRGDLFCHEAICESAAGYAEKRDAGRLVERGFDARGLALPDALFALGAEAKACPYELQLDAAREALVTVCDFNYAIDPGVMLPELRDPARLRETILVIDEIHRLPERASAALSVRIDGAAVRAASEAASLGGSALHRDLRDACESLHGALACAVADAGALPDGAWLPHEPPRETLEPIAYELRRLAYEAFLALEGASPGPAFEALFALDARLERFLEPEPPGSISLVGREGGEPQLERFCRDPSHALARLLGGCHALVGCSATLSPPEWFAALLGLDPARAVQRRVASADASARRTVVIDASVTTAEKSRARETPRIARRLAALSAAVPGMIRVVQSAGRLIRGESDRGVIALFDRRFLREPYASLLPDDWLAGRPLEELVGDPAAVARQFFESNAALSREPLRR